jgi:hypothetical protein
MWIPIIVPIKVICASRLSLLALIHLLHVLLEGRERILTIWRTFVGAPKSLEKVLSLPLKLLLIVLIACVVESVLVPLTISVGRLTPIVLLLILLLALVILILVLILAMAVGIPTIVALVLAETVEIIWVLSLLLIRLSLAISTSCIVILSLVTSSSLLILTAFV